MKMKEFMEKADEVEEIRVIDEFKNGMIYRFFIHSKHKNVENHVRDIVYEVLPTIEDYYHTGVYMINKEVVDNVVQVIKNSTDYEEMQENLLPFKDMLKCGIVANKKNNKIVNVCLSWRNWNETCALRNLLKEECEKQNIKILSSYEFNLYIKSEDCDDKERCKLFCEEQTRMRKIDRIFGLD